MLSLAAFLKLMKEGAPIGDFSHLRDVIAMAPTTIGKTTFAQWHGRARINELTVDEVTRKAWDRANVDRVIEHFDRVVDIEISLHSIRPVDAPIRVVISKDRRR